MLYQNYIVNTCSECGCEETIVVAAPTDHSFGEWCVRKAVDEGHSGIKYRTCVNCGYEDVTVIPITDHQHTAGDWYVSKTGNCSEKGEEQRDCSLCDVFETRETTCTGVVC